MKIKTINTILSTPLTRKHKLKTIFRFFRWGIKNKFYQSFDYKYLGNTKLRIKKGSTSAELQYYCGLYDFVEMGFLLHFLRKDDIFIDVGANVGVYSLLASGYIGSTTYAFEPIPSTFQNLNENIKINNLQTNTKLFNIGISSQKGTLIFSNNLDAVNHVLNDENNIKEYIEIPVDTLDNILSEVNPTLLKIDVEGYETMVIKGAINTLKKQSLKAIIIELNGLSELYKFDEKKIHEKILEEGFKPYTYNPFDRQLIEIKGLGKDNTIYLRDIEFIMERIISSKLINVYGSTF